MRPLARPAPRSALRLRRPTLPTAVALVTAALTFAFVHGVAQHAEPGGDGRSTTAWITTRSVEPGERLGPDDVAATDAPIAAVPTDAVTTSPAGRVVRHPMGMAEIVVDSRLSGLGASGVAALLEPGERAVAIPRRGAAPPVGVGEVVEVLATGDPITAVEPTYVVVERARIVAVDDDALTIAVGPADAVSLAHAAVTTTLTVAVLG